MTTTYGDERTEQVKEFDRRVMNRVQKGIELLEKEFGKDWVEHINMDRLALDNGSACVLGQLYGDYSEGKSRLFGSDYGDEQAAEYGFYEQGSGRDRWDELDRTWKIAIESYSQG